MSDHDLFLLAKRVLGRGPADVYFHIACLIKRKGGHEHDGRRWAYQSQAAMARVLGCHRQYVIACLEKLLIEGWIDRHRFDYGRFAARYSYTLSRRDLSLLDPLSKGKGNAVAATDHKGDVSAEQTVSAERTVSPEQTVSGNPTTGLPSPQSVSGNQTIGLSGNPTTGLYELQTTVTTQKSTTEINPPQKENNPPPEGHPPGLDEQPAVAGEPWPEVAAAVSPTAHGTPSEGKKTHSQEDLAAILERKRREIGLGAPERRLTPLAGTIPHKHPSEAPQSATEARALKPAPPAPADQPPDSSFAAMKEGRRALESAELQQAIQAPPKPPQEPPPPPPAPPTPHRPPTARRRMRPVDLQPVPNLTPPKAPEPSASPPTTPVENSAPPDPPPQPAIETKPKKSGKIVKNYKPTDDDIPEALAFAGDSILSFWSVKGGSSSSMAWNSLVNNLQRMQQDGASRDDIVDLIDGAIQGGWSGLKMSYWHDRKARKQQTAQRLGQSPDPSADPKRRPSNWFNPAFR